MSIGVGREYRSRLRRDANPLRPQVETVAVLALLGTIEPELDTPAFGFAMAALGIGLGLIASQLGNVIQSSVDASGRGEAGGLQYTAQQLGSSLGVALIGAIVLTVLATTFTQQVADDDWTVPLPPADRTSRREELRGHADWVRAHAAPWVQRRIRGVSSGDALRAKRPQLTRFRDPS